MADPIQDKINRQAETSKNDMLWGKPANDILNDRAISASAKPIRALWEMVQNTRIASESECNIGTIVKCRNFPNKLIANVLNILYL